MDETIINDSVEEIGEAIIELLENELPGVITEINALKDDDISLKTTVTLKYDSPLSGFSLLDVGQYPVIFVEPVKKKSQDYDTDGFSFAVSGWVREENLNNIVRKRDRFTLAVEVTLKKDFTLGGIMGGGMIGSIDYSDPLENRKKDPAGNYIAFAIELLYTN
jgi:hypothetical protein